MRTIVTFQSDAFNTTEPKEYFINDCCYGDDVLNWLREELNKRGAKADEPGQEDFGWYMFYEVDGASVCIVGGVEPEERIWTFEIENNVPFFKRLFGGESKNINPKCIQLVDDCLKDNEQIRNVRWHIKKEFEKGKDENGSDKPF